MHVSNNIPTPNPMRTYSLTYTCISRTSSVYVHENLLKEGVVVYDNFEVENCGQVADHNQSRDFYSTTVISFKKKLLWHLGSTNWTSTHRKRTNKTKQNRLKL